MRLVKRFFVKEKIYIKIIKIPQRKGITLESYRKSNATKNYFNVFVFQNIQFS